MDPLLDLVKRLILDSLSHFYRFLVVLLDLVGCCLLVSDNCNIVRVSLPCVVHDSLIFGGDGVSMVVVPAHVAVHGGCWTGGAGGTWKRVDSPRKLTVLWFGALGVLNSCLRRGGSGFPLLEFVFLSVIKGDVCHCIILVFLLSHGLCSFPRLQPCARSASCANLWLDTQVAGLHIVNIHIVYDRVNQTHQTHQTGSNRLRSPLCSCLSVEPMWSVHGAEHAGGAKRRRE